MPPDSSPPPPTPPPDPSGSARIMSSLRLVSLGTIVSRILGLFRDMGMTSLFGAGTTLDAFIVAFRLPNLARQLLGEGALSTAFLPLFVRCREQHGDRPAREMMTAVAFASGVTLCSLVVIGELIIGGILWLMEPAPSTQLLLQLAAIMLPYALLICLSALFCAALHAQREFLYPALVPISLNLFWLLALLVISRLWTDPRTRAFGSACAVTLAGGIQLLIPLWALRQRGMGLVAGWHAGWPFVRTVFQSMLPVVIGMSLLQASAILDSLLAWGFSRPDDGSTAWCQTLGIPPVMESGTASALYIGQRMYQLPLGVFGVALGTVLYPLLSQHAQQGAIDQLRADLSRGLRIMLSVALPASAGLCLLSWPLTLTLFRHGEFNEDDTRLVSRMISIYGTGVWCYIGLAILNRAFYATNDRITPMRLGFLALGLNFVLNLSLIGWLGGMGLALGSVLAACTQLLLTLRRLNRHIGPLPWEEIRTTLWKSLLATGLMSLCCLGVMSLLPAPETFIRKMLLLGVPCLSGVGMYFLTSRVLGLSEIDDVLRKS